MRAHLKLWISVFVPSCHGQVSAAAAAAYFCFDLHLKASFCLLMRIDWFLLELIGKLNCVHSIIIIIIFFYYKLLEHFGDVFFFLLLSFCASIIQFGVSFFFSLSTLFDGKLCQLNFDSEAQHLLFAVIAASDHCWTLCLFFTCSEHWIVNVQTGQTNK